MTLKSLVFSKRSGFQFSRISVDNNTSNCLEVVQHNMNRCCSLDIVFLKIIVYMITEVKNCVVKLVVSMNIITNWCKQLKFWKWKFRASSLAPGNFWIPITVVELWVMYPQKSQSFEINEKMLPEIAPMHSVLMDGCIQVPESAIVCLWKFNGIMLEWMWVEVQC